MELDSHADTIILGKECVEIYNWNHLVKVSGYNPKDRERLCKTISGEVVHDHPHTGKVCLLIFHQCIHANHPDHHLLCSIQCRMHGVEINETPKFLLKKPTDSSHAIVVEDPEGGGSMVIPLLINGVTSYFTCRNPTRSEYEDGDLTRIYFSAEAPEWDPSYQDYTLHKESTMDFSGYRVNLYTM